MKNRPIIYVTDTHITKSNIKSIKKDVWKTVNEAFSYISKIVKEKNVSSIICGGDVTHSWNWKDEDKYSLWSMFNRLPVPFYTIVGNHDVLSGKLGLLQFSALGSVINIKPDQSIWDDNIPKGKGGIYLIEDELIIDNFHIVGYHWNDPLLQGVFNNYARVEEKFNKTGLIKSNDRVNILVSHSSVGPEKNDYCTAWDELEIDERIDFALFGDIHVGFGPSKLNNGVVVGNPGAFYRGNISEISHKPGFYLIYPNKKIEWHALPQDSDESYFDLDRRLKSLERKRLDFATAKAISTAAKNTDPKDYVRKIGKEANYSDEAINEVLSRLDKVKIKE